MIISTLERDGKSIDKYRDIEQWDFKQHESFGVGRNTLISTSMIYEMSLV